MSRFLPFLIFLLLCVVFGAALLTTDTHAPLPSALIGKPMPEFSLPTLNEGETITQEAFNGHVTVLNIFASWCVPCRVEHEYISELAEDNTIRLIGIAWRDKPEAVAKWLSEHGNPYRTVGVDAQGSVTTTLGITGVPETYIIDKGGIIRYKRAMPITQEVLENEIWPLLERLKTSASLSPRRMAGSGGLSKAIQ